MCLGTTLLSNMAFGNRLTAYLWSLELRVCEPLPSWRAGFVMSARQAGIMPAMIRNNGRWTSVGGPLPYTIETLDNYQQMTKSLVNCHTQSTLKGADGAGGQFASSSLLL